MADYPELLILRHGETEWNLEGRMQGALDSPLTDRGRAQAAAQNKLLKAFDLSSWDLFSSPQGRARMTAGIVFAGLEGRLKTDPRLVEIGVGDWAGRKRAELWEDVPNSVNLEDGPDGPIGLYKYAPNGEGFGPLRDRVADFLSTLRRPSVLVTHGITSRMLRAVVLKLPPERLGELPGGQGVIYHLKDGAQIRLE